MLALAFFGLCFTGVFGASVQRRQVDPSCSHACPENYDPVCASNHQTYSTKCEFQVAECLWNMRGIALRLYIVHEGPCDGSVVPGSPAVSSGGSAGSVGTGVAIPAFPGVVSVDNTNCDQICDEEIRHICASDGNVYQNQCLFQRAQCEASHVGKQLTIVAYNDTCPKPKVPECSKYHIDTSDLAIEGGHLAAHLCPTTYHYVCGSDGQSYVNECFLCQHMETSGQASLMIQYDGVCHSGIFSIIGGIVNPFNPVIDPVDPYYGGIVG